MKIPGFGDDALGARMTARMPTGGIRTRSDHLVCASQRQRDTGSALLVHVGQAVQPVAEVLQPVGDQMDDVLMALDAALDEHQPGRHDDAPVALQDLRPDDRIGDAGLILQGHEHHPLGAAWSLAHQHHTGQTRRRAISKAFQLGAAQRASAKTGGAQERHWMRLERQFERLIVVHHMLRQRHFRQPDGGLRPGIGKAGGLKQRQGRADGE